MRRRSKVLVMKMNKHSRLNNRRSNKAKNSELEEKFLSPDQNSATKKLVNLVNKETSMPVLMTWMMTQLIRKTQSRLVEMAKGNSLTLAQPLEMPSKIEKSKKKPNAKESNQLSKES
jgi:hypothetical protein